MRTSASVIHAILQLPCGMHHRWLTVGEAERLVARGECRRIRVAGRKCIGKARPVYRLVPPTEPSDSEATPAAITPFDLEASLGLRGTPEERKAAREKISVYLGVH